MAVDYSKYHSILDSYEPYQPPADQSAPTQNTSALGDFGTDLKRGLQQVPSAITGLLDIPVAAVTGRPMVSEGWEGLGQITGFQPQKWADEARAEYSPERQAAQQQAAQAEGFVDTAGVYLSNPSMIAGTVLESIPSIALGGVYGRALRGVGALSGVTRGAIGEGAVMAGQSMNEMVEDGVDPRRAAAFATGVGAAGGALGVLGGSLTQRMGLIDPDTLAAGGVRAALPEGRQPMGLLRRVTGGAVAEGVFEEMPQTMVETVAGNLAAERPWDEDLGKNAAVGLLAGGLMGGVVNIPGARRQRDLTQDAPPQGEQDLFGDAAQQAQATESAQPRTADAIRTEYSELAAQVSGLRDRMQAEGVDKDTVEAQSKALTDRMRALRAEMREIGLPDAALSQSSIEKRLSALDKEIPKLEAQFNTALQDNPGKATSLSVKLAERVQERELLRGQLPQEREGQLGLFDAPQQGAQAAASQGTQQGAQAAASQGTQQGAQAAASQGTQQQASEDPVVTSLRASPVASTIFKKDGSLKRNVEEALTQYNGLPFSEIERELESLETSRKADAVWRIAMLESIRAARAQETQPQGAPDVQPAQVDAASGQGTGAVPAGSTGNTPDRPVDLGRVDRPAGAPAPGSAAGVPVGEPVVQQPAGVEARQQLAGLQAFAQQVGSNVSTEEIAALPPQEVSRLYGMIVDARRLNAEVGSEWTQTAQNWIEGAVRSSIASQALGNRVADMKARAEQFTQQSEQARAAREARKQGAQPANVPPTQQVAPQAQTARGQEGAQIEQAREPVVTAEELRVAQKRDVDPTAPGAVRVISSDGVERWVTPSKTKTAAKGKRAAGERVPFEQLRGTEQQMVRDFMGYDEFGEVSEEVEPMSLRQMASVYGVSHETLGKRLAALGYTNEAREQESAAEETFLTETVIGREDASPELSDEAIDIADVVGGNLRVQKGVGAKGDTGAGRGYQKLLTAGTRFDARRDGRPIWSEAAIAEAVASNALSDEQLVAAEKELAARAKREADERAAKQSKRGERAAPAPRTQEQIAQEGRAVSRAQNQAEREARVRAEREAAEQEVQRRVAAEAALQRKVDQFLATPESQKAASYWNRFADEGVLPFADLPQELQVEWVQRYIETLEELPADRRVPDAMEALQSATQQEFLNDEVYQQAADAVGEAVAGGDPLVQGDQGAAEGNRPDEVSRADAREEVSSTPTARDVGRTAAREYAAGALTRLQQYYDAPNLAALASRLENASDLTSLDSELDTDLEWVQDLNLSNDLAKIRRDAAAIERLAAAHPEAFELGYLRAQDYGGFASDGPVREMIGHMAIASARPSAEFGSPRDYYVQRDAQASEGVNQIDSRTLGVGNGNRFSRASDTQGTTVEAVRSAINAIATPMGRRKITIVQSADELVERGVLNSSQARGTQGYVTRKGDAYFIADNIRPGNELAVVLHEIGAHLGIEKLLTDKQYESLVKKIFDWAGSDANTQESRIARAAIRRVAQANIENEADLSPETIAYFIEEAVKAGVNPTAMQYKTELGRWFRTLWAAFKVALRRLNLINADRLTAQNVVDLAYGAARIELASTYHGTAANFRRFDHRFMGSGEGAQAFGWGTYLAQRFGIANEYFEADVGRKSGVLYKGEAVKQSWPRGQEPTDLETALAAVAARFADSYSLRTKLQKGTVTTADFKSAIADAQYELASDNDMAAHDALENVRPEDFGVGQAEGNIHIVDVNFTEDEMLDWFEPISKQSPQVREALEAVFDNYDIGIAGYDNLDMTGEQMYKRLSGSRGLGSDKAASEYLDSLGVKGIKFLDAKSRGNDQYTIDESAGRYYVLKLLPNGRTDVMIGDMNGYATRAEAEAVGDKWRGDKTRNLVVFNDRNIYRVGSMRGGPVGKGGRMMFSKAADPQLVEIAQESGQRALKAIQAGIRKGWTGLAFSSHLANAAHRAGLTSARALELVQRKKATRAYEIQIEVEKVLSKFASLEGKIGNEDAGTVVQRFIYDSTFDKKWGFKPEWKNDAVVDPEMERRFQAIERANPEAANVVKDVFRHGDTIFREKQDLLRKTITGEYEALIKAETDDGKRRKLERQRDKELREAGRLIAELNGPYAPLRRYGNYVVVAKSQKYRDAEAAGPVDAKLKRDENHYVVEFAETLFEAEKLQSELESKFGKGAVWAGEKEASTQQFGELPFMAVQRLRKMVDTDLEGDLNTKSKRTLNKLLVDLYISTLHEANARHSEQKRQYVNRDRTRAAQDMMRAFATQGRADSHLVSALQFNSEIVDEMQKLRNEAKNGQGDSLLKTRLRNEILQRHMMDLDFRETPVQDKLMSLNSFWMLLTSPGYYVQNATQVMMMTQPVLAGKFGQNRSMRQLMRGYQDAMRVLKGSSWNEAADLSRFNGTADEKAMLIELQARGTLDFGISAELGYWESRGEISKVFNQVMRKVGMGTRKLEVLNRMSSALAAYRMMYDQTTGTQAKRHAAALDYADSIIKDTHGDYSTTNAPRYLRMMPKVMTQFRKFQLIQLSLFAKVIHGSIKGANPQEKRAMRAALGYLFMNHALLAGAVGVPASALLGAVYAIAGDDDDPNDWEVDVRRAIGDKEMADLILHGLPSLININMSNKIGAGTMLDPLPFVEYEATRGGYEKAVTAAMGPLIGGLGAQVVDAFGRILKGDVAQGTAQLLPRGFRDAARGFMAAQDGIQLRNGQTALTPEELSFYDSLMMGLGLPTLKTTSRTETQFKTQQYETFFRERVTKLKRQYSEAYEKNDRQAMLEARQAWAEMQASRKNLGFKVQPLSELLKAPREKAKAEAKLQGGVRTTEQARGFVQSLQ